MMRNAYALGYDFSWPRQEERRAGRFRFIWPAHIGGVTNGQTHNGVRANHVRAIIVY